LAQPRVYSFKSSGEFPSNVNERTSQQVRLDPPIGIKTPLQLGEGSDGLLKMHRDLPATIGDNLKNLLLTNKGERLMDYNFGANLKELCFELGTEEADAEAINRIRTAVGRYLPFVSLETFEPINETDINGELAKVGINITYKIPVVSQDARRVEVILYTVG
jgi:phage baseplate assembly protein W